MSVLAYPRIHFNGRCLLSPATANNDDTIVQIEESSVGLLPSLRALGDAAARDFLIDGERAISPTNGKTFFTLNCSWNYFGDASVRFQDVAVGAAVGLDGHRHDDDPIVGQPVRLPGKCGTPPVLCDVDPTGVAIAQLFVGGLEVGDDQFGLWANHDTRAYSRWIVWRNTEVYPGAHSFVRGGATWQFAIPSDCLHTPDESCARSRILRELIAEARMGQGIQVQFGFYLVRPFLSDAELRELFLAGFTNPNPAEAFLVGTIGVWEDGELQTSIIDRLLEPPPGIPPKDTPRANLGPASARVHHDRSVVSLNLITAFPEANYHRPPDTKADLGTVHLGVIPAGSNQPTPIGKEIRYKYPDYWETGGIVDVSYDPPITPEELDDGTLVLISDQDDPNAGGKTLLTEAGSIRTIETDDQAVYLAMDGPDQAGYFRKEQEIEVLIRERGRPPEGEVTVWLWEYQFFVFPAEPMRRAHSRLLRLGPGVPMTSRIGFPEKKTFQPPHDAPHKIKVTARKAGSATLAFTLDGNPPRDDFPLGGAFFMEVRVLPEDEYPDDDSTVDWPFMYREVFRYYHMIFPAMSKIIPFNNREKMEAAAGRIVDRTDSRLWPTTLYMPITRDLSIGKRKLIVRWAAHVHDQGGGENGP